MRYRMYGLVIGVNGKINPYIVEEVIPADLAMLYGMNIIDYPTFMEKHPALPINPMIISKLAIEINPWVYDKSFNGYLEYFEMVKNNTIKNGGKFTIDPMVIV